VNLPLEGGAEGEYSQLSFFLMLSPFSADLFGEIRGLKRNAIKTLGPAARNAIEVWRFPLSACLAVAHVRSLSQLLVRPAEVLVSFDASYKGLDQRYFPCSAGGRGILVIIMQ